MLKTFAKFIRNLDSRLVTLLVCVLAFGLFIPVLGFYWDDWPTIFYTFNQRGAQLVNHFSYDRPFSVWAYWLVGRLGTTPWVWQLAALAVRFGIVLAAVWALKPLWAKHSDKLVLFGLIFAIYPGYYLQASSVIFIAHLLAYLFFFLSLGFMVRAMSQPDKFGTFTALALATAAVHLFTLEYFVGLELVRPVVLWLLVARQHKKAPLQRTLKLWWPYALLGLAWVAWRLFLMQLPVEPYPLVTLEAIKAQPLAGSLGLLADMLRELVYILISTWSETVQPQLFSLAQRSDWLVWAVVAASFSFLWRYLATAKEAQPAKDQGEEDKQRFAGQALALGLVALVGGMLPVWIIGERVLSGDYNLRYILVGMFGAALIVVAVLTYLISSPRKRGLVVALMVALTLGSHLRAADQYRQDWQAQRQFYWQLSQRAPGLEQGTALVSFERVSTYLGDPMTGNALNVLYPTAREAPNVGLWNFELNRSSTVEAIEAQQPLSNDYRGLSFTAQSADSLLFYYQPEGGCLWVLSPADATNEYLPFEHRELVAKSNLGVILPTPADEAFPPQNVFGAPPASNWCTYFEKSDLARQQGDWRQVLDLMEQAEGQGFGPNIGMEWLPLVEAYAHTGQWAQAEALSLRIHQMHTRNDSRLCATWQALAAAGGQAADSFAELQQSVDCSAE